MQESPPKFNEFRENSGNYRGSGHRTTQTVFDGSTKSSNMMMEIITSPKITTSRESKCQIIKLII
jgi:hypothetical protein